MADNETTASTPAPREEVEPPPPEEGKTLRIMDQPFIVGLSVTDDAGNTVVVNNSVEGVLVPTAQVEAVHQAADDAGILIEEVST